MDFIDTVVNYFSNNILLNTLLAIIFFIIGAVANSFFEPFGKKLHSIFVHPKVDIKINFENRGYSLPRLQEVQSSGMFGISRYEPVENNNYNYYINITNTSEIALNNINLNFEHDIKFISDYEDDEDDGSQLKKKFYIDHLQVGQTVSFCICNERSLVNDTLIKIIITLKESKKEIIQNKILSTSLDRIWQLSNK